MADDKGKKPKIDLKARLGKTIQGGPAVPLPVPGSQPPPGEGGVPTPPPPRAAGIAPPPGISPGIPIPPFAQTKAQSVAPPKPTAAQQTIKVEVGEEIHQERKAAAKRGALYAGIAAVVGIVIGWIVGGAQARNTRSKAAVTGAAALEKEVKTANDAMKDLGTKLAEGADKLGRKEFPTDLDGALTTVIPFDTFKLDGKHVGDLPADLQKMVFSYTIKVEDLNKTRESLKNLLGFAKPIVEKVWKQEKDPVVSYSVTFRGSNNGMLAELVQNKETFPANKEFPGKYVILKAERSQQGVKMVDKNGVRWTRGDLTGNDPVLIPVDPATTGALTGEEAVGKLAKALRDSREILEGSGQGTTAETSGLIKEADVLLDKLHKAGLAK
jgi:hypothetical protein